MAINADKPSAKAKRVRRAPRKPGAKTAPRPRAVEDVEIAPPARLGGGFLLAQTVRQRDITVFLRQLIMLLEAGTPILKSLKTLAVRGQTAGIRELVSDIAQYVEAGNPLWQSFERHPRVFPVVFVNLIRASEASGTLVPVLQRLAEYRERRDALRMRVKGAMIYPVILLFACFGVVMLIAKWVIPSFQDLFSRLQVDLPPFTLRFIAVNKFIDQWWWMFIVIFVVLVAVYKLWFVRNPLRRLAADRLKLRIPIVGPVMRKNAIVEFTRTLSLLLRSGLSMMATLDLVRNAIHNQAIAQVVQNLRDSVEQGAGLEQPLRESAKVIPGVVTDMLVTGEESGSLDKIAEHIANTYEEEVNIAVAALGDMLQPIITLIIGAVVVVLAIALFVPLVSMIEQLSAGGA